MATGSESLHFLVPTYRRDSAEVIGAVRRSSVEFLGMEQMPGGKFQITARTISGADTFVSPVKTSLAEGQACLEQARREFGGEEPGRSGGRSDDYSDEFDALSQSWESAADPLPPIDETPVRSEPRIPNNIRWCDGD